MTKQGSSRCASLLASLALCLSWACLVPPAAADVAAVATPEIASTAVQVGTTTNYAIPPDGMEVTVTCATEGAAIHYTLDGSEPTEASPLYEAPVAIAEGKRLTGQKNVVFKAKAFKAAMDPSAVASATYINYAVPEFSMRFKVEGNTWGPDTLEFGMKTGATDELDPLDTPEDGGGPIPGEPGLPPPPESAVMFTTGDGQFLSTDYRSRTDTKLWRMQAQLLTNSPENPAEITLKWGTDAGAGFGLPAVASLRLLRKMAGDTWQEVADLTESGTVVISSAEFPDFAAEDDEHHRIFYVECIYNSVLQVNLGPAGLPAEARWKYRELGGAYSDWRESGTGTVPIHPGNYEVELSPATGFYRPPNQIVTIAATGPLTVAHIDYMTKPTQATMTVESAYNETTQTVALKCTFTFSPEVSVTQVVWTFDVPPGWTISDITGLPEGWTAAIDGNVVTFTYAGGGRGTPVDNHFDFDLELEYEGAGDPDDDDQLVVAQIRGSGDAGDVEDPDLPEGAPLVRTATLDVDGDGDLDGNDALFIYRKIVIYDFNETFFGAGSPTDVVPNPDLLPPGVTAQDVLDAINALGADLDVDEDGDVDGNDALFIYRKIVVYNFNETFFGAGALSDIVPDPGLLPPGVTAEQVKNNIEALEP